MNDAFFKPSHKVDSFVPDNSSIDSENFLEFVRAYYEWLQSTRITLTDVSGTFQKNETVTGQTSNANGIIREVGTNYLVILVRSDIPFSVKESLLGSTSGATATVSTINDNTVRATGKLLDYRDLEKSIDTYQEYLQEELFPTLPKKYLEDKSLIATKLKSFFQSRSTEESYRFLFKLFYNENVEFRYPGEEILRASDGKFEKTNFIRVVPVANVFEFINKTIRGTTSNAFGTVVDIKQFFFGTTQIAELTLKLVSGTFLPNETVVDVSDSSLTTTTYGMVTGFNIIDGGSGYVPGNQISISGDGNSAFAIVSTISQAPIDALSINEIGYGYRLNTQAVIDNTGTGGANLSIEVTGITNTYSVTDGSNTYTVGEISEISIINRGENYFDSPVITIEDSTITSLGLLSDRLIEIANSGIDYGVGNTLIFTGGSGANAAGQVASVVETVTYDFLLEDSSRVIVDGSFEDILKNEDWDVIGPIRRVELTNFGDGYTTDDLPAITISTTTGSGANLIATNIQGRSANVSVDTSNNSIGVGSIRSLEITNAGLNYSSATVDATGAGDGNANIVPLITGLSIKDGEFLNDDGKIGIRVLIDSFFFQDFSYVIKSGLPFSVYRDELKKIIHPAGLQPFGEILLTSELSLISDVDSTRTIIVESEIDVSLGMSMQIDVSEIELDITPVVTVAVSDISAVAISEMKVSMQLEGTVESNFVDSVINFTIENEIPVENQVDTKITLFVESEFSAYTITYKDLRLSEFAFVPISTLSSNTFNEVVRPLNVESLITKYKQIQGTVSSSVGTEIQNSLLSDFQSSPVQLFENFTFESTLPLVTGNGTIFTTDFSVGDTMLANSELFTVSSLIDDTSMIVNRNPTLQFTDVFAYKVIP